MAPRSTTTEAPASGAYAGEAVERLARAPLSYWVRRCARAYGVYSSPAEVESCTQSVRAAAAAGTVQRASEI